MPEGVEKGLSFSLTPSPLSGDVAGAEKGSQGVSGLSGRYR